MWRAAIFVMVLWTLLLASRNSRAESALVVLVRPAAQSVVASEAITRIRGELLADGFDVLVVDAPPGADPASVLARADRQTGAAATLGLFLQADAKAAELWVVDRLTNKTVVRSVEITQSPDASAPEVLARRSVELLRASLLEILVDARKKKPRASTAAHEQASRWAEQGLESPQSNFSVEAGAQVLGGFGGVGPAVMPVGRVRVALSQRLAARLTLSGLGTRPSLEAAGGTATVSQELGLLELVGTIAPLRWLRSSISLGAGAYHIGVEGSAAPPYASLSGDRFAFAADAGAGLALSLTSSLSLSLEGHAILVTPNPVIRFLEEDVAKVGNPLLSGALTLVAQL